MEAYPSFSNLKETIFQNEILNSILKNSLSGHIKESSKENETLSQHQSLCLDYFLKLSSIRKLDSIYDSILVSLGLNVNLIKQKILEAVFYHDIGKLNPNFQKKCHGESVSEDTHHSVYSYYLLVQLNKDLIKKSKDDLSSFCSLLISKTLSLHHTSLNDLNFGFIEKDLKDMDESDILEGICNSIKINFFSDKILINKYKLNRLASNRSLFYLIKLFYSHLVLSDYYSTLEYTYNQIVDIKKVDENLLKRMEISFETSFAYNKELDSKIITQVQDCNSLNECRLNLLIQAHKYISELIGHKKKIFMLNVPTGGGKTNISLKLALDIFRKDKTINKAFWVFPYINIIEQNYKVIKNTLFRDSTEKEIEESLSLIHSSKLGKTTTDTNEDSLLNDFQIYLDDLFLNNPINVISNVNFFDSFLKVKKSNRHKVSFLANSVVIIDEIQTLKIENMGFFYHLLLDISTNYNIYFVIMSATLPNLNYFVPEKIPQLIENYREYFNSKFFKRNSIEFINKDYNLNKLKEFILNCMTEDKNQKLLVCMNTINTSINLFQSLSNCRYDVFLLNSLTPPKDRIKINDYIKKTKKKILLVSTQSIEAGVDLDFDIAIRDNAILDSIEQVAGRVNRGSDLEKNKTSKVYVIRYKDNEEYDYKKVYGRNLRLKVQEKDYNYNEFNIFELKKEILAGKDFDKYYKEISLQLKKEDKKSGITETPLRKIELLEYENLSKSIDIIEKNLKEEIYIEFPIEEDKDLLDLFLNVEKLSEGRNFNLKLYTKDNKFININLNNLIEFRSRLSGFLDKPLNKKIESILGIFSVSFFVYSNISIHLLLKNNDYISENNVATQKFKSEFLRNYKIGNETFFYVNVPELIKKIKGISNEAMII